MKKEDYLSVFRMAREIPASTIDIVSALNNLGYIEKDLSGQRKFILSEKGIKHGRYISMSHPVFDEGVFEEVKKSVEKNASETMVEVHENQEELVGRKEKTTGYFQKYGHNKVDGKRTPWLIGFYSGVDENEILCTAEKQGLIRKQDNIYVPTEKGLSSGVSEERTLYFNVDIQKKVLDELGMRSWYQEEVETE